MTPELEKELLDKYPKLFSNKQFYGIECGDGWYDILDHLCGAITEYTYNPDDLYVDQVKEKFGRLRFYLSREDDVIHGMITMAEYMSAHTCETCGKQGKVRGGSWLVVLCDEHHEARIERLAE
jgi:hypothetical protein